jgi:hypothetical protein
VYGHGLSSKPAIVRRAARGADLDVLRQAVGKELGVAVVDPRQAVLAGDRVGR